MSAGSVLSKYILSASCSAHLSRCRHLNEKRRHHHVRAESPADRSLWQRRIGCCSGLTHLASMEGFRHATDELVLVLDGEMEFGDCRTGQASQDRRRTRSRPVTIRATSARRWRLYGYARVTVGLRNQALIHFNTGDLLPTGCQGSGSLMAAIARGWGPNAT